MCWTLICRRNSTQLSRTVKILCMFFARTSGCSLSFVWFSRTDPSLCLPTTHRTLLRHGCCGCPASGAQRILLFPEKISWVTNQQWNGTVSCFSFGPLKGFVFGFGTFYENCSVLLGHQTGHWRYQFWIQYLVFWFCACLGMCLFHLQKWMCSWSWATFCGFDKSEVGCSGREGSEAGSYCCVSFRACGDFYCILKEDFLWSHLENFQAGNAGVVFVSLKWNRGAVVLPRDNIMNFLFNALSAIWIVAFWCMCMNV